MSSTALFRAAARCRTQPLWLQSCRAPRSVARAALPAVAPASSTFSTSAARTSGHDPHAEETFEQFTARYEQEFEKVQDVFELQRNLNNSFAYDLVPSTTVIVAALKAARRVNDFPSAVRIFEGIKAKVENRSQYEQYLEELEPLRKELGIDLKESLYPNAPPAT